MFCGIISFALFHAETNFIEDFTILPKVRLRKNADQEQTQAD